MTDTESPAGKRKTPNRKTPVKTPETKSVKFLKSKTPLSNKKKFAKTPHSSKTPHIPTSDEDTASPIAEKRKRKLFSEENANDSSQITEDSDNPYSPPKKNKLMVKEDSDDDADDSVQTLEDSDSESPKKTKFTKEQIAEMIKPKLTGKSIKKEPSAKEILHEKTENTVFVGNLPVDISKSDIKKLFSKFGHISSVRLRCAALIQAAKNKKGGTILKQFEPGTTISAYVKFSTSTGPKASLRMNGNLVKGHHIRVDMVDQKEKAQSVEKNKSVFLRNLPFDLTDDELWSAFSSCGLIASVRIIKNVVTYRGRGLGYVNFKKPDSVELALKMNGSEIKGRPVIVQRWGTRIDEPEEKKKRKDKKKRKRSIFEDTEDDEKLTSKKVKKRKGDATGLGGDFSGNKALAKKNKRTKKPGVATLKKKKIAQIMVN